MIKWIIGNAPLVYMCLSISVLMITLIFSIAWYCDMKFTKGISKGFLMCMLLVGHISFSICPAPSQESIQEKNYIVCPHCHKAIFQDK